MIQIYISLFSFFGGILVALIGGWFALSGHRISKANSEVQARLTANVKLAEFRQNWINNLRNDMSRFHSLVTIGNVLNTQDDPINHDVYEVGARIELNMNPTDTNFKALQQAMAALVGQKSPNGSQLAHDKYIAVCQLILKSEWDVLKEEVKSVTEKQ